MKPVSRTLLAILIAASPSVCIASAATLRVTVQGVRNKQGSLRIGVCREREFLSESCAYHAVVAAHAGSVETRITGIAPGRYGVAVYQDRDGSGKLKRNFLGMPQEDTGFSRDPGLRFGPPGFAESAITIGVDDLRITVNLHHFGPS